MIFGYVPRGVPGYCLQPYLFAAIKLQSVAYNFFEVKINSHCSPEIAIGRLLPHMLVYHLRRFLLILLRERW